ncbi:MAG: hypothetical protein GZ094_07395 [Mariniphaga sp.]|nr:hypothetical protein [Mariniphaga sp.]
MKKSIFGILMICMFSVSMAFAGEVKTADNNVAVLKTENKLTTEEVASMTKRVEEIRNMDKSNLTSVEKRELRKEVKGIKENVKKNGQVIYISAGTILLIILILILI